MSTPGIRFAQRFRAFAHPRIPGGTVPVALGVGTLGLTSYVFLVVAARGLDEVSYAQLAVVWSIVFTVGPGVFAPIEVETSRLLAGRSPYASRLRDGLIRQMAIVSGSLAALLVLAAALASPVLVPRLLGGDGLLFAALLVSVVSYAPTYVLRGRMLGVRQFGLYGGALTAEGLARLIGALVLFLFAVRSAGAYGLALAIAPLAAFVLANRVRSIGARMPRDWRQLREALGALIVATALSQLLINAGPIAVQLLATPAEAAAAGVLLSGLAIARIPVFVFAAVQSALLPQLAVLVRDEKPVEFRRLLRGLVQGVLALGVLATTLAAVAGPWLVRLLFGPSFGLRWFDMALLALATSLYILSLLLAQVLIAVSDHRALIIAWAVGLAGFAVLVIFGDDLLLRVASALVGGTALTSGCMVAMTRRALGRHRPRDSDVAAMPTPSRTRRR